MYINKKIILVVVVISLLVSCVPYNKLTFFNDFDSIDNQVVVIERTQKLISPYDNLLIKVLSIDEKNANIFNTSNGVQGQGGNTLNGFMVNEKGEINFPFVGSLKVSGFTTFEASEIIQKALSDYISNTAIIVKYIDNKVTIMGEVQRQGSFVFVEDKINIYQALALAGGFTRYGSRSEIVLIRTEGEKVKYHKIDVSNSEIAKSDFFYILPNDIIVVEPLRSVSWSYQNMTYSTVLTSISTVITIILAFTALK